MFNFPHDSDWFLWENSRFLFPRVFSLVWGADWPCTSVRQRGSQFASGSAKVAFGFSIHPSVAVRSSAALEVHSWPHLVRALHVVGPWCWHGKVFRTWGKSVGEGGMRLGVIMTETDFRSLSGHSNSLNSPIGSAVPSQDGQFHVPSEARSLFASLTIHNNCRAIWGIKVVRKWSTNFSFFCIHHIFYTNTQTWAAKSSKLFDPSDRDKDELTFK